MTPPLHAWKAHLGSSYTSTCRLGRGRHAYARQSGRWWEVVIGGATAPLHTEIRGCGKSRGRALEAALAAEALTRAEQRRWELFDDEGEHEDEDEDEDNPRPPPKPRHRLFRSRFPPNHTSRP